MALVRISSEVSLSAMLPGPESTVNTNENKLQEEEETFDITESTYF